MDKNSSMGEHLTLALTSDDGDLYQPLLIVTAMPKANNLTLAFVFQIPSSHSWPTCLPGLELWGHNAALCLSTKKKIAYVAAPKPQKRIHFHSTRGHHKFLGHPVH